MKHLFRPIGLALLVFVCTASAAAEATLYLVRHAEKASDGTRDPDLTREGQARAEWLAGYMANRNISSIHSTGFKRTQQTAAPTAKALGLEVQAYNPRQLPDFARQLKTLVGSHLVVGHSNTTPALASLLTGTEWPELEDYQYDHIYVVTVAADGSARASVSYSEPRTNPFPEVAALKRAMIARLQVMRLVARYKWNEGLPIEAPAREAEVLEATVNRAVSVGLDPAFAANAIAAQMDAAKSLQRMMFEIWEESGPGTFAGIPSLDGVIRPRINVLTESVIDAYKTAMPHLGACGAQQFFAETPAAFYDEGIVWQTAAGPLVDPACFKDRAGED